MCRTEERGSGFAIPTSVIKSKKSLRNYIIVKSTSQSRDLLRSLYRPGEHRLDIPEIYTKLWLDPVSTGSVQEENGPVFNIWWLIILINDISSIIYLVFN